MKRLWLPIAAVMLWTGLLGLAVMGPSDSYAAAKGKSGDFAATRVPEPGTIILFGTALAGLAVMLRRRHKRREESRRAESRQEQWRSSFSRGSTDLV
ncbi:MAG TPA: PEP-CTERM sorting domain-containing protein [Bryobacteraceae bacterium]|nr:PEP-CTERM sorting domain-containing protein [Bryobacteraceae bacterium]